MSQTFKKIVENFICGNCGKKITGNGYTNHCPRCLWSRHVDIHPGDRSASCGGMMQPVQVQQKGQTYVITHRCQQCGHKKNNTISDEDDFHALADLASQTTAG